MSQPTPCVSRFTKKRELPTARFSSAIVLTALLLTPWLSARAQSEYLALITDLSGGAMVARAGQSDFQPAVWGMQLFAGDRVKTETGGAVSILFSNNSLIVLGENSAMTVSGGPGTAHAASRTIEQDLYGTIAGLRSGETPSRGRALAGLRAGDAESPVQLLSPRNTKLMDARPTFRWKAEKEYDYYSVRLYDASGLVWTSEVEGTQLDYPKDEPSLIPGTAYFWDVEGHELLGSDVSAKTGFTLVTEEEAKWIADQEASFASVFEGGTDFQFAVGTIYSREGLMDAAIASFEAIAERHPTAALPQEILANLYAEVGLMDRAEAAQQRAELLRIDP